MDAYIVILEGIVVTYKYPIYIYIYIVISILYVWNKHILYSLYDYVHTQSNRHIL